MSSAKDDRKHETRKGFRRRNKSAENFLTFPKSMLESPAYKALSLSARRVIDRVGIEWCSHAGFENGRLPVTFADFQAYGIGHNQIAPGIREAIALGFITIERRGRAGNADFRQPNLFRVTFMYTRPNQWADRKEMLDPTHEWKRIKDDDEAREIAKAARDDVDRSYRKQKTTPRKGSASPPESGSENGKGPLPKTGSTGSLPNRGVLSRLSGVRRSGGGGGRGCNAAEGAVADTAHRVDSQVETTASPSRSRPADHARQTRRRNSTADLSSHRSHDSDHTTRNRRTAR